MRAEKAARRDTIKERIQALTKGMPSGWQNWDAKKTSDFKSWVLVINTYGKGGGSFERFLMAAGQIAELYGQKMVLIDPEHGQSVA